MYRLLPEQLEDFSWDILSTTVQILKTLKDASELLEDSIANQPTLIVIQYLLFVASAEPALGSPKRSVLSKWFGNNDVVQCLFNPRGDGLLACKTREMVISQQGNQFETQNSN